jgi:L-aminopeptidase/D-esterase-like protein
VNNGGGWETGRHDAITDVAGIRVGHWTERRAATGCTVIRCEEATFVAVDCRGGAPGTRETEVLAPSNVVRRAHAIVLTGGSAFGLASASGVMRYLSEQGVGFPTTAAPVPIVPAAVLFDLGIGRPDAFPGEEAGYLAAKRAKGGAVEQGSAGAGTGATVAKMLGMPRAMKGGIGTASVIGPRGLIVGALVANNAVGSMVDPETAQIVAAPRDEEGTFIPGAEVVRRRTAEMEALLENTSLICVATNADVQHHQLQRLATQAHDGLARVVVPAHTFADGDIAFAIAMGQLPIEPDDTTVLGMMTVHAVERALVHSIRSASSLHGVPAWKDVCGPSGGGQEKRT